MYPTDRSRPPFQILHAGLHALALRRFHRFATVSELAEAAGCDTERVITALGPFIDNGTVRLEAVEDEVFVHTGADGRPIARHLPDVPPTLWELLRRRMIPEQAYLHWRLLRDLEASGWETECGTPAVTANLARTTEAPHPLVGVYVGHHVVPVVAYPTPAQLAAGTGPLEAYERAGAPCLAVLVPAAGLDAAVTATRRWVLDRRLRPGLSVLVLEAPRFDPTLITASDPAVPHRAVDRLTLASWDLT